jgi:hypothetical protein
VPESELQRAMNDGARRSAAAVGKPVSRDVGTAVRAFLVRRRYWIIGFLLFLLLDLIVALGVAGSAGHF